MNQLEGEIVLITGAGRGIGAAIAHEAGRQGARVAIIDVSASGLDVRDDLRAQGVEAVYSAADVTDDDSIAKAVDEINATLGAPTIVINNAGRNSYHDPVEITRAEWEAVFAVDLTAAWAVSRFALPTMKEQRRGSIVNIASIHATATTAGMFPYAAAKSGLIGLTRSMALDVAAFGIRVNALSPGFVATELVEEWLDAAEDPAERRRDMYAMHPLSRIAAPDEIARVACFLASDAASFVTGAEWIVDGGLTARFA